MMDINEQLKLQAYLDGELGDAEAREMANRLTQDRESMALMAELRNTRQVLVGFEKGIRLTESEDFYWSQIRRRIEAQQSRLPKLEHRVSWVSWFRRRLAPVTAMMLVAFAGLVAFRGTGYFGQSSATEVETALGDPGAFTYRDYSAGTTLVWLSYPAEN